MKLPNANRAIVDESKIVEYLLSARHPDGRSKAAFFSGFGFRAQRWVAFARALRDHGSTGEVTGVSGRLITAHPLRKRDALENMIGSYSRKTFRPAA